MGLRGICLEREREREREVTQQWNVQWEYETDEDASTTPRIRSIRLVDREGWIDFRDSHRKVERWRERERVQLESHGCHWFGT